MACNKKHRRMAMQRKLQVLRTLTKSKSVKESSIIMNAFLYIYNLRLQVEAIHKEVQTLINHIQEVKVERVGDGYSLVRIRCKRGEKLVVTILEAFEEMGVSVLEARVCSNHLFGMEAIVKAEVEDSAMAQALLTIVKAQGAK